MKLRLPHLPAFAKAQLWGMGVGFALAMLATDRMGYGLPLFFLGWLASWVGFEAAFARRMPSHAKDAPALALGVFTGFVVPWGGFALAAFADWMR